MVSVEILLDFISVRRPPNQPFTRCLVQFLCNDLRVVRLSDKSRPFMSIAGVNLLIEDHEIVIKINQNSWIYFQFMLLIHTNE